MGVRTPSFLEGRSQFTQGESMKDRDDCFARYSSEAYFSRVTKEHCLKDKIPQYFFQHLQSSLNWAMVMANLCQPFMTPRNAGDDYFPKDTIHQERKRRRLEIQGKSVGNEFNISSHNKTQPSHVTNFIDIALPEEYFSLGLQDVGLLNDGKDFLTDTVLLNSCLSRGQYSD
jgi:hypothetical protein